ncbi:hypothetical protein ACFODO_06500 [Acinetobacter sichuanensis]|uniref:Uncharacterized protein n=1 Tax=Acinetobacter sichuanensis TaxID=2136183 RepID=A0A371YQL7_9GAMM|nr:hypothetical protein [Acinetobacter sichuanensis]RFC83769.1 hypothetical protein C9E89_009915 [Acinetobacter sichuanensis]
MNKPRINIAISGLGLVTTEKLKIKLREVIPQFFEIYWGKMNDEDIQLVLIHEFFFETENIQKIIFGKNLAYLKVSKDECVQTRIEDNMLYLPIQDIAPLKDWIQQNVLSALQPPPIEEQPQAIVVPEQPVLQQNLAPLDVQFITDVYDHFQRKVHVFDELGSLAIIDHHMHLAWINPKRTLWQTNGSLQYAPATIEDFIEISRKHQDNLENWLFALVWNSPNLCVPPYELAYFKLKFWPQPTSEDRKIILQLSACFMQGAEIQHVATKLGLELPLVQRFITANLAIQNAELVSAKECKFDQDANQQEKNQQEVNGLRSFFGKLKRRFGF